MKVGDLVKYLHPGFSDHSQNRWIGLVVEVHGDDEYRVKWFDCAGPIWYSKKKLEVVNESR